MSDMVWCFRKKKKRSEKIPVTSDLEMPQKTAGEIKIGKLHEQGARSGQQDCFGVSDESLIESRGLLSVVADGMGGLSDGDKVSAAAVEAILDSFTLYQGRCTPQQELLLLTSQAMESVGRLLGPSGFGRSGSTLVMGILRENMFSFLSVGDSRISLYRNGVLMQLNREHIYRNQLALNAVNGEIPFQEIYTDQRGSGLVSFLGMGPLKYLDIPAEPVKLLPGDKIILMSDGVYNALENSELEKCLAGEPEKAAEDIRLAIQEKGYENQDNYTAVIIEWMPKKEEVEN